MSIKTWVIVLFFMGAVNTVLAYMDLKGFLSRYPSINCSMSLEDFKRVARHHMYQALLQIVFLGGAVLLGAYGISKGRISLGFNLLIAGAILGMSLFIKGLETRARSMRVDDESLADQYRDVCRSWEKKALPDF